MMGYVKDWSNVLEGFFQEMFFEAKWMFLPEEVLPVHMMKDGFYDMDEEVNTGVPQRWLREEHWEENEEKQTKANMYLEELLRLSFAERKNFVEKEGLLWESFREKVSAEESFKSNKSGWAYKAEDFEKGGDEAQDFEKMLYGERVYNDVAIEALMKSMTYGEDAQGYDMGIGEGLIFTGGEYGGYVSEREKISLSRERVEKILNGFKEAGHGQSHEIKIEMVRNEKAKDEFDMDETLDMLTERLCSMMAKGADGFYL